MKRKKYRPIIHPNASKFVVRTFKKIKTIRGTARQLDVNPRYVHDNLIKGIEPPDTTEKYCIVRKKMKLPAKIKRPKKSSEYKRIKPYYIVQWEHLSKEERHAVILNYMEAKSMLKN